MRLYLDSLAWVYSPPSSGHLGVTRPMLSNIINGKAGVSAAMALKFADAFPKTDAPFWLNPQANYGLSKALCARRASPQSCAGPKPSPAGLPTLSIP